MIDALNSLPDLGDVDNVVTMPNLMNGRLADLLAAAGAPVQEHELRGELAARTAFQAAVSSWPNSKRRLRRTPAAIAVTTVATMLVATTSLAAASVLPGPANRAVDGILGSVGVDIGPPATPPTAPGTGGSAAVAPTSTALGRAGVTHVGCSAGEAGSGSASGSIQTASCTISAPHPSRGGPVAPVAGARSAAKSTASTPAAGTQHNGSQNTATRHT
ncbi:MAG TPA: hypothetical protein VF320_07925, partial [Acidimicrobiales bacterium]